MGRSLRRGVAGLPFVQPSNSNWGPDVKMYNRALKPTDLWGWGKATARPVLRKQTVGDVEVSTAFIGVEGMLFETMLFPAAVVVGRYSTQAEAYRGHGKVRKALRVAYQLTNGPGRLAVQPKRRHR